MALQWSVQLRSSTNKVLAFQDIHERTFAFKRRNNIPNNDIISCIIETFGITTSAFSNIMFVLVCVQ